MDKTITLLGFGDEILKLAQKRPEGHYSPKAVEKRLGPGPIGPPEPALTGPRPAPGTRMPKFMYPEKTWTPKPKPRKGTGVPKAEGIVPGTFQRRLPRLPSGKKMPRARGIVSAVGERKKWEADVKKQKEKLPAWMSDAMKRPVKGHSMATPEAVARSKRESAEAKGLVSRYSKKDQASMRANRAKLKKRLISTRGAISDIGKHISGKASEVGRSLGRTFSDIGSSFPGIRSFYKTTPNVKPSVAKKPTPKPRRSASQFAVPAGYESVPGGGYIRGVKPVFKRGI